MRRYRGRGLSSGTSPERIAPESVTHSHSGFVHRNISRGQLMCGTRSSLARSHKSRFEGENLKVRPTRESNQKPERVKPRIETPPLRHPHPDLESELRSPRTPQAGEGEESGNHREAF